MQICCDLEIDVNGQEKFFANKKILASFSGRLRNIFSKSSGTTSKLKVIFHGFPGGPEAFELISRYCYNRSRIKITLSNSLPLHLAAIYMEMNENTNGGSCLINETREEYLEGIQHCSWSELVDGLKRCQELLPLTKCSSMLQELLDCLVRRLPWPYISTTGASSTHSSFIQFSGDISTERSSSTCSSQTAGKRWFGDLDFLNVDLLEKVVETMIAQKLDSFVISSFLFHYQKFKFRGALPAQKRKIIEILINLLYLLNGSLISVRGLFHILQCSLSLEVKKSHMERLECLIASLLDRATLDDLLFPSPRGKSYAYDVNLILRLQKQFLNQDCGNHFFMYQVKKVAFLIDYYIAEVAPDPYLTPSKFMALATTLPGFGRDSHDIIYEAMDVYFKVHNNLSDEEKIKLCCVLNYDKLSAKSLIHLAHNSNFPARATVAAAVCRVSNLRALQKETSHHEFFSDLKVYRSECGFEPNNELGHQGFCLNKPDVQTIDGRFRILRSMDKFSRKKQTRAANNMKLSSTC